MRRAARLCVICTCIALAGAPAARADDACPGASLAPDPADLESARAATACLLDTRRVAAGRHPLPAHPKLSAAAERYAHAMVDRGFFAHVSPGGQTLLDRLRGYVAHTPRWSIGENLAWGTGARATPDAVVAALMASPEHRHNVLRRDWRAIGVSVVAGVPSDPTAGATYVVEYGTIAPARRPARSAVAQRVTWNESALSVSLEVSPA